MSTPDDTPMAEQAQDYRPKIRKWVRYSAYADTKKDQKISQSVGEISALMTQRLQEFAEQCSARRASIILALSTFTMGLGQ